MNNPFDLFQNNETKTEQESQRLKFRLTLLLVLFCALLLTYLGVLFNLQVVHGQDYLQNANYTNVSTETVDTVRGQILDRSGNVMVSNRLSYYVTLDLAQMGNRRIDVLSRLIQLCREEEVVWSDSLALSDRAPWAFTRESPLRYTTTDSEGETVTRATLLGALAEDLNWVDDPLKDDPTAEELLTAMCLSFDLIEEEGNPITPQLRAVAGVLYELYLRRYQLTYSEYVFAKDVDITFITRVKEQSLPGVSIETDTVRTYLTDSAAHLLGPVGPIDAQEWPTYRELGYPMDAIVGKGGVELAFESYLHGSAGVRRIETDQNGNLISETWSQEPAPGGNVVLTIDEALQTTTEQLLAEFVSTLEEQAGAAAVMVDMTGGVLALASYPTYKLDTYYEDFAELSQNPTSPYQNRATHGLYAPGSTFKMVTAAAALSEGVITPRDTVICTGLYHFYDYANYTPKCWIYPGNHASETVSEAIKDSCNVFFYDVGRRTGIQAIVDYATKFGLGQKTGIEIGEYKGSVAGPQNGGEWYGGDTLSVAIGQGANQFTPLQLANYIATLVNGGSRYQTHLLKEVKASDFSRTLYAYQPVVADSINISQQDMNAIKKGMYDLSKTASMALHFSSLPFEVGCKTGTAEVSGSTTANATFVCFAPYDDPQVALCIVVEQGDAGGSLAAIAAGMLSQYFSVTDGQNTVGSENELLP